MRTSKTRDELVAELEKLAVPENRTGMARFGIRVEKALGVAMPDIRAVGKTAKRDHDLAQELWDTGLHEVRILASLVDEPHKVTRQQMDQWAGDFNSWDLCDQVTGNLFDRVPFANAAIDAWRHDEREFVKRAAFAMIAWRVVHLKKLPDDEFMAYLPMIREASRDSRNFVRKSVNWALRQIGKRSAALHAPALQMARELADSEEQTAAWIGKHASNELNSRKTRRKLGIG